MENKKPAWIVACLSGLCVLAIMRNAVAQQTAPNPIPGGVCYGFMSDSCKNVWMNGMRGESQPCPSAYKQCMVDVGIPVGQFVCQSCSGFSFPPPGCPGCTWSQVVNVYSYYGSCNGGATLENCNCNLSDPNYPLPNVAFICGGV